jgi:hypothetical protein
MLLKAGIAKYVNFTSARIFGEVIDGEKGVTWSVVDSSSDLVGLPTHQPS